MELVEKLYGPTSVGYATVCDGLGSVPRELRRFDEATRKVQAATAIVEGRGETNSEDVLMSMAKIEC